MGVVIENLFHPTDSPSIPGVASNKNLFIGAGTVDGDGLCKIIFGKIATDVSGGLQLGQIPTDTGDKRVIVPISGFLIGRYKRIGAFDGRTKMPSTFISRIH